MIGGNIWFLLRDLPGAPVTFSESAFVLPSFSVTLSVAMNDPQSLYAARQTTCLPGESESHGTRHAGGKRNAALHEMDGTNTSDKLGRSLTYQPRSVHVSSYLSD